MNLLSLLVGPLTTLIEKIFPNPAEQERAKAEMLTAMNKANQAEWAAKSEVVVAEVKGESWMQRNWRPLLMMVFIALIINNYILVPYLVAFGVPVNMLPLPPEMWTLLTVGVGGYIVGRSGEKIYKSINEKKFYESLREQVGPLNQQQVDAFNKALRDGQES